MSSLVPPQAGRTGPGKGIAAHLAWVPLAAVVMTLPAAAQESPVVDPVGGSLTGDWAVFVDGTEAGTATIRSRLGDRFTEIEFRIADAPISHGIYLLGFDGRHDEHTVVFMDDSDSYWVTARGVREGPRIAMYGTDRDPNMEAMGLTKEFVFVLSLDGPDRFRMETRFIDTRTSARTELPFLTLEFRRAHH